MSRPSLVLIILSFACLTANAQDVRHSLYLRHSQS